MARSSTPPDPLPIQQLQTVADLLEIPPLARIYAYILQTGPVSVAEIIDDLGVPQGSAYEYVQHLEATGLVENNREKRPYEYDAEPISPTLSTDGGSWAITPALIVAVARRDVDQDIDRRGIEGLAVALDFGAEYVAGSINHRIAARKLELSPLEVGIILHALEPIVEEYGEKRRRSTEIQR